jgi:hypothetical protein
VAKITLSRTEADRIERISDELDEIIDEFFADARPGLSCQEWDLLKAYASACVRRAIEVGAMLHAVVDGHPSRLRPYPGRGRDVFVKAGLRAWRDSFAPIPEVWKIGAVLDEVAGGEQRVLADVETLEVMAANRMFESLDDQCASFLSSAE